VMVNRAGELPGGTSDPDSVAGVALPDPGHAGLYEIPIMSP